MFNFLFGKDTCETFKARQEHQQRYAAKVNEAKKCFEKEFDKNCYFPLVLEKLKKQEGIKNPKQRIYLFKSNLPYSDDILNESVQTLCREKYGVDCELELGTQLYSSSKGLMDRDYSLVIWLHRKKE